MDVTFEEFLEKAREKDGWRVVDADWRDWDGLIRNGKGECPLAAVFGDYYGKKGKEQGLPIDAIMNAADGKPRARYRKALLGLVKP